MDVFDSVEFDEDQQAYSAQIRNALSDAWDVIDGALPDSREKSLVKTNLQQAGFWAQNAIAVNDVP